jgi:hypothetical protein
MSLAGNADLFSGATGGAKKKGDSSLNTTAFSSGPMSFPSITFGFAWS